ncbi:FixH family protein [Virgibacillus xinjiangensis]|uniref:FixH family protein n=1 Tax=Virgibacillus xinjiangensis TaxID=393090 RepID=A0ABV7CXW1_9BACI
MINSRWNAFITLILAFAFLSACNTSEEDTENAAEDLPELKVDFRVPDQTGVGESVELTAEVTYGGETVEDAEVAFEYWKSENEESSKEVIPEYKGEGEYKASISFEEEGMYEIYSHVTAEGLHTMPLASIQVGDGALPEEDSKEHEKQPDGLSIHFKEPDQPLSNDETELVTQLEMDGAALEAAQLRYEIWKAGEDDANHQWAEAEELSAGEYQASHSFPGSGTYTINVHVENESGLHEHQEFELSIE